MGRGVYVVVASIPTVTGAKTLIQVKAVEALEILRATVTGASLEVSDTAQVQLLRKTVAATVTSFTPIKTFPDDQAAKAVGGTAATGHTATVEGTNGDVLDEEGFNVLSGYRYLPVPEERIVVDAGGIIALKSNHTIDSQTLKAVMVFREIT